MAARSKIQKPICACADPEGGGGSGIPGKSQAIWVSVIGPSPKKLDPLEMFVPL